MRAVLQNGLDALGVSCTRSVIDNLCLYWQQMKEKNKVMNLTAITDDSEAAQLHFLDSAAICARWDIKERSVIDVGTGAGLPGMVLKILCHQCRMTLFDSLEKRLEFLDQVTQELGLQNVETLHGRAEEASHLPEFREKYDYAVSRAVAQLPLLCELCLPFVKVGGSFLAMKSQHSGEELLAAEPVAAALGASLAETYSYTIPGTDINRLVYCFEKTAPTPEQYPRRWAKLKKLYKNG